MHNLIPYCKAYVFLWVFCFEDFFVRKALTDGISLEEAVTDEISDRV